MHALLLAAVLCSADWHVVPDSAPEASSAAAVDWGLAPEDEALPLIRDALARSRRVEAGLEALEAKVTVPDGWYAIEALTCIGCPTNKAEYAALQRAGWDLQLVDETHPVVALTKPEALPAVVWIRDGVPAGVVTWPFDRWDVGAIIGRKRPTSYDMLTPRKTSGFANSTSKNTGFSATSYDMLMYVPSGNSVWTESGGGTSFGHLVGHGYDPAILRNTPTAYYGKLHGDAHEGRRSRVVPVETSTYQAPPRMMTARGG